MEKFISYIKHPGKVIIYLMNRNWFKWLNDKSYIKLKYKLIIGKKLNLKNPQTFNEKLQWLKLNDRNPEHTIMVDKYEAKKYIANLIGEEYIIPNLGVWDRFEDIKFDCLPDKFVLKPTHTSGNVYICKDKSKIDYNNLRREVNKWLKREYYYIHREWPYKDVKPRIIAEEYMEDKIENDIIDYKFFCFGGKVETILVCSNRNGKYKNTDFYNTDWKKMNFTRRLHENNFKGNQKPCKLKEMIEISEKLSQDIPFVRVDLYEINKSVYFGELTFFPSAGFEGFNPEEWDLKLGKMLKLPK